MRLGSLFAGIGGFDLAARWMGWETAWFSEIDPYASSVLAHHWPGVPNHGDITTLDFRRVEPVDMLCGGFPCQDISNAGKRKGIEGERSGLWREYARAIGDLRPRYVVVENSADLVTRGLDRVLGDLADLRYDAEWTVLSACAVGAPHMRERVYLVAYPNGQHGPEGLWGAASQTNRPLLAADRGQGASPGAPTWVEDPSALYGGADGLPYRVERNHALGNAIVPQCAFVIFQRIQLVEDATSERTDAAPAA